MQAPFTVSTSHSRRHVRRCLAALAANKGPDIAEAFQKLNRYLVSHLDMPYSTGLITSGCSPGVHVAVLKPNNLSSSVIHRPINITGLAR